MGRLENKYKSEHLIPLLEDMFPGCTILWLDPQMNQGIPDLMIVWGMKAAFLEVKRSAKAAKQPNQEWHINRINREGGFASFIFPENEEEVLDALQSALQPSRRSRYAVR